MGTLRGVLAVLPVPFATSGEVDWDGFGRVAGFALDRGAAGLAFGFGSEYFRLSEAEREEAVAAAVQAAAGRAPVLAPCSAESVAAGRHMVRRAREMGAAVAVVNPPTVVKPDLEHLRRFFAELAAEGLPIMIQDAPQWSGVNLPVSFLAELCDVQGVDYLKVEAPPTWVKIQRLRERLGPDIGIFGGYGGLYLYPELVAGVDGVMPSAAHPDLYLRVMEPFWAGRRAEALGRYQEMLPYLIAGGTSLDEFIWIQKEILRRLGVIRHPRLRAPAGEPDPVTVKLALSLAGDLGVLGPAPSP